MPAIERFDTPGSLRDLPADHAFYDAWHRRLATLLGPAVTPGDPRGAFVNASKTKLDVAAERRLTWMGFPRALMSVESRDDRRAAFAAGEERTVQEEYLEWHVTRRRGKITKVVFVTETPEYWEELATADRAAVVGLYRRLASPRAAESEIFSAPGGSYNRANVWNTERGIVHYVQRINTLADAVGLAKGAVETASAQDNFEVPSPRLTSADPRVELDVGVLARRGLSITVRDPIGLYMVDWDDTGWTKPNGEPVDNYWTVTRGGEGTALRLEYEVPASEPFAVGDIRIGGRPIDFGGQIAEHITVMIAGMAGQRRR